MQSIADSFWALLKFRSKSRLSVFCLAECKLWNDKYVYIQNFLTISWHFLYDIHIQSWAFIIQTIFHSMQFNFIQLHWIGSLQYLFSEYLQFSGCHTFLMILFHATQDWDLSVTWNNTHPRFDSKDSYRGEEKYVFYKSSKHRNS